jgi:hypothetical protein
MNASSNQRSTERRVDIDRIATNHERELHGWAKTMGTSPERLARAVQAVGITPRKVRAYLREHA